VVDVIVDAIRLLVIVEDLDDRVVTVGLGLADDRDIVKDVAEKV
ncbi:unnamed protein product, partial [uncultured virus]